jgi:cytochrome b561
VSTPELEVVYGEEAAYLGSAVDLPIRSAEIPDNVAPVTTRHPALTMALHWGTVAAIIVSVSAMLLRDVLEDDAIRASLLGVHRQLGLAVLLAAGLRVLVRVSRPFANHGGPMPLLMRLAASATHLVLYGLLLALPLVGWALMSAHEMTLSLFGLVNLPPLVQEDADFADTLGNIHVWLAWGLLAVVFAHAAAALWHHHVRRDGVLRAMLPGRD